MIDKRYTIEQREKIYKKNKRKRNEPIILKTKNEKERKVKTNKKTNKTQTKTCPI